MQKLLSVTFPWTWTPLLWQCRKLHDTRASMQLRLLCRYLSPQMQGQWRCQLALLIPIRTGGDWRRQIKRVTAWTDEFQLDC